MTRVIGLVGLIGLIGAGGGFVGGVAFGDDGSATPKASIRTSTDDKSTGVEKLGESLFAAQCASCHGDRGQGTSEHYADPLHGDGSIEELTSIIADTMPEEDPDLVVGDQARAVAQYIYDAFYSADSRKKTQTVRPLFSRLTADQFRRSLTHLYTAFDTHHGGDHQPGLWMEIRNGYRWKKESHRVEKAIRQIDFDFGRDDPADGVKADDYGVDISGCLTVPHSGFYEIVLRCTASCKLRLMTRDSDLVDNETQSAGRDEFRRRFYLISGIPYHLDLNIWQRPRKTEQPAVAFSLSWVPPGGVEELIPPSAFTQGSGARTYVVQTKLPPDDSSYGYQRGVSVDRRWDQAVTAAAIQWGNQLATHRFEPYVKRNAKKLGDQPRAGVRQMITEMVTMAFSAELDDASRAMYVDSHLRACPDDAMAIRRAALMAIKSPRFLYPELPLDRSVSRRHLNRLSLILHDALPTTKRWLDKAEKDQLIEAKDVRNAAAAMADSPETHAKIRQFLRHWMELDGETQWDKNADKFPGFDPALVQQLNRSLDEFIADVVTSPESDFRQLVAADWTMTSPKIAEFYGDAFAPRDGWSDNADSAVVPSRRDPQVHVGVLTHPLMMSNLAYHDTTSPIHRGVYLTRFMLGRVLRPPNEAFTPLDPNLHPGLTTRQRVELQTGEKNCLVCHTKINGLGFALEQFDAVGRFRELEVGKSIDASGQYLDRSGATIQFRGARELGDYLARSDDAAAAFVEAAFEHFVKQPPAAFGPDVPDRLLQTFKAGNYHIRNLIIEIAATAALGPPDASTQSAVALAPKMKLKMASALHRSSAD